MRVRPKAKGAVIRDPKTKRLLPESGGDVPDSKFWRRRLASGDVEECAPSSAPPGLEPVTPLINRAIALPAPAEHGERQGAQDAGEDDGE